MLEGAGPVEFKRSDKARRLTIRMKPFAGIRVTVPKGLPMEEARQFVRSRRDWIIRQLPKMRQAEQEMREVAEKVKRIDRITSDKLLKDRLDALAAQHGFSYNRVTIRCQKTRWGSCSAKNNISLNRQLVLLPGYLIDYVLLHELVHTRVKNHGPLFWAELDQVAGEAKQKAAELKKYRLAAMENGNG